MSNVNWHLYDEEQNDSNTIAIEEPIKTQKIEKKSSVNWDIFDPPEFSEKANPKEQKQNNPFSKPSVSKEDYEKMSLSEKIQYAKDLEKEQNYERSKAFSKNAASALTFGFSEDIPGFKPEEGEDPLAGFAGTAFGSLAPIIGSAKIVGAGIRQLPKVPKLFERFMHAFGTGATYETGKQSANAIRGEEVNLSEIPIRGAEFATIDAILKGVGKLGRKFIELSPSHQAQILEQGIIPDDLPKSQYETAEEVLNVIRNSGKGKPIDIPPGRSIPSPQQSPGSLPPGGGPPTPRRNVPVTPNGEDLGLRPISPSQQPKLQDEVGNLFSKDRFYNTTQGGKAFKKEIMNLDEDVYRGVNDLYKTSRELNSGIEEIHPQLISNLENSVSQLKKIPEPSDVQKRLIRAQEKILKNLAEYETIKDEAGNVIGKEITGYKPFNNQTLIDQIQSLRQIIDYDFSHGNTKNIFKPLINDLQDAAIRAAESTGNSEAAQALNEARAGYRAWAEAFDNDYIRPFRDSSNQDFSKLFKSALDLDESNMIGKILDLSENGQKLHQASVREIVDKHLDKYFNNSSSAKSQDFDKAIRELEAVISPEQAQQIKELFKKSEPQKIKFRAKEQKRVETSDERIAAKYKGKEPEDIQKMMDSRSGIRQLREDLSDTKTKKEIFDRLSKQKMRSILREGNIERDFTGDDFYRFLNKEKNYELFSEILGEAETEALRTSAKEIGKNQMKSETRRKGLSKAAHKVAFYKSLELILSLL